MHERMLFVVRLEKGERMTDLCREFGISRKTGYKIYARYKELSLPGLEDAKRVPERIPHRTSEAVAARVVALRTKHPTWGPRKLRGWLLTNEKETRWPAASTIGDLLSKKGLLQRRKRRQFVAVDRGDLREAVGPNDLWCIDYKGQFRLGNGSYCYPLTVTDAYSRFLLVCEGMNRIDGEEAWVQLKRAFQRFGVPRAIRSDNGSPFASRGVCGLSMLSAKWIALGVRHERIDPGKPQQNGRHERMHRTLKAETTRPAAQSMLAQQERFDRFMEIYNDDRPHEALDQTPPARHYEESATPYAPVKLTYPLHDEVRVVKSSGHIYFGGGRERGNIFITSALAGHPIGLRELDQDRWLVTFAEIDLGVCDLREKRLIPLDPTTSKRES